ncbi:MULTISPECIES: sel1 repeat family protein [Aeromonas]|uniref:sel1 repeat family protein n=1 Tax=Aeromonas TaxID=642 RepID=UPI0015FEFCE0|nr:sel1 repeat family protein [Aeromonas veronii]MBL0632985.1 sel1 repeat family protein [Aeromonas veronii]QSR47493.1 sel1 repeat family protein [Aeromonas veronii]HDX8364751.1 sel1 repeat family protein [Aeromonas veronii]
MKKLVSVLLLAGLCFGVTTAQAKAWRNAPFAEVQQAAEQGDYFAQFRLGEMYAKGRGVAQDHELAYVWYSVAAANDWGDAVAERDTAAKELTPAVLADAQTLAGEYFEKYQQKR